MKVILTLVKKDLLRSWKRPWGTVIMLLIPLGLASMLAMVIGGGSGGDSKITIPIAVVDQDDAFFGGLLKSMGSQGDTAENLRVHVVETVDEGIALLEKRKASALLILPENMTVDLLEGVPTSIRFYPNPAERILPRVVEQGTEILAVGVSQALATVGPQIKAVSDAISGDELPPSWIMAQIAYNSMEDLRTVKSYFFPPILQFETVSADDFVPSVSQEVSASESGGDES